MEGKNKTWKELTNAMCYASIILNIIATLRSFIVIHHLGRLGFEVPATLHLENRVNAPRFISGEALLMEYGASSFLSSMVFHCR